tara:strand:+ start:3009 stop:4019 length:1011 start_codon:yes stop_codon:yes gene_type:complete
MRILSRYNNEIEIAVRQAVGENMDKVFQIVRYQLGWVDEHGNSSTGFRGKGLRPTLCLQACAVEFGDHKPALPAAASIELLHNFTLIHDDVMDRDATRRNRSTVWSIWGDSAAINAGDLMYALAISAMANVVPDQPSRALQATSKLLDACVDVILGQQLDLDFESRDDVSVAEYENMAELKTAALIATSLEIGATIGGASDKTARLYGCLGRSMGLIFQMRDDYLSIWGDAEDMGKSTGVDIRRKKKSLPIIMLFNRARENDYNYLLDLYGGRELDDSDVLFVMKLLEDYEVRHELEGRIITKSEEALELLLSLNPDASWMADIQDMIRFIGVRGA